MSVHCQFLLVSLLELDLTGSPGEGVDDKFAPGDLSLRLVPSCLLGDAESVVMQLAIH